MQKSKILLVEVWSPFNEDGVVRHIIDSKKIPRPTKGTVMFVGEGVEDVFEGDIVYFDEHTYKLLSETRLVIEERFIKLIERNGIKCDNGQ